MSNHLSMDRKALVVSMLCEGSSIRAIERITNVHRDTIMRLGVRVGEGCHTLMDSTMRNLGCTDIQVDEIWGFIGAKRNTMRTMDVRKTGYGDVWTWIAIDAETKLIPSYAVGDRSKAMACQFMDDLASRLKPVRVQITSDALSSYVDAIERAFGCEVDYGTVIKTFTHTSLEQTQRYSPPDVLKVKKAVMQGRPNWSRISTSFVEKQNHTLRMHCRRLTRLTNAFSKKLENFEAAVAMNFAYYNLVKTHITLRCTPAMAAGVASSQWTIPELLERIGE